MSAYMLCCGPTSYALRFEHFNVQSRLRQLQNFRFSYADIQVWLRGVHDSEAKGAFGPIPE